ncbi:hypothetical protein GmHk_12G035220 [Glycine max]|nr:hypothetical protein GmHk_12G035220 [Glycine max]
MECKLHPSKVAAKAVTLSIKPSTSGAIPKDHQELFFQRFKAILDWRLCLERSVIIIECIGYYSECARAKTNGHLKRWVYAHRWFYQLAGSRHSHEELGRSAYVDGEEFEARLSQARSNAASSVDPAKEQRRRSQCWVVAAGPKHKGRLYST